MVVSVSRLMVWKGCGSWREPATNSPELRRAILSSSEADRLRLLTLSGDLSLLLTVEGLVSLLGEW